MYYLVSADKHKSHWAEWQKFCQLEVLVHHNGEYIYIDVKACVSGYLRHESLSPSKTFSSKSKNTLTDRVSSPEKSGTVSPARGRNSWARERVKAHTRRCREHITRQNLQQILQRCDSTDDDVGRASDQTGNSRLSIGDLTVDVSLGSGSTPKSSPASFSDVCVNSYLLL